MRIPGAAWVALIGLLVTWIGQYFGNFYWSAGIITVLGMVAKMIELYYKGDEVVVKQTESPTARGVMEERIETPNKMVSFFLG